VDGEEEVKQTPNSHQEAGGDQPGRRRERRYRKTHRRNRTAGRGTTLAFISVSTTSTANRPSLVARKMATVPASNPP